MSGTLARSLGALGDAIGGTANVNFDANTLFIDGSANNVGVGTTLTAAKLMVVAPSGQPSIIGFEGNGNAVYPPFDSFGGSIGYNFSAGGAEVDFWNNWSSAGATQAGFMFRRRLSSSTNRMLMNIRGDGYVLKPLHPAFHAYGGGSVSVSVSNYILALSGTATNVGSHFNTSTFRFTAPVAGVYMFAHRVTWGSTGTGVAVYLAVNGSSFGGASSITEVFGYTTGTSYHTTSACVTFASLNASDFVDLRATVFNSSPQTLDLTRCSLSGYLMG